MRVFYRTSTEVPVSGDGIIVIQEVRESESKRVRGQGVRESESQKIRESESLQSYPRNILGWFHNHRVSQSGQIRSL